MTDKILFVDDDANLLASFRRQLRKQFQIETALGGPQGLKLVDQNGPYAVIVSDFRMPHMDGIEFLSRVREVAPDSVRIMLTGNADMQAAIQAVNEGNIFRFLTKPCAADLLGESLITGIEQNQRVTQEREYNERSRESMAQAMDVQQNLIPKSDPEVDGLDIAGKCIFCDETGGDYYDFIPINYNGKQKIGVAIGDVSGHGISSALLMATVRSSLRQRVIRPGSIAEIISDVNRQLVQDVEDSGQFMTMFFLALSIDLRKLEWVRAGHDPAIIYDPSSDSFNELSGSGIALGVDGGWIYEDNKKTDFSNGQIIFLSTDGIWEARNKKGEMLGKERILNAIQQNASSDAAQIIDSIFDTLNKFIGEAKIDDDITSVVIKM